MSTQKLTLNDYKIVKHKKLSHLQIDSEIHPFYSKILYYDGDLEINETTVLDTSEICEEFDGIAGIYVRGDLTIYGSLIKKELLCRNLFVDGSLYATNLILGDAENLVVKGSCKVDNIALLYKDFASAYSLKIEAKFLIVDCYDISFYKASNIATHSTRTIDLRDKDMRRTADYYDNNVEEVFQPHVISYRHTNPFFDRYKAIKELTINPSFEIIKKEIKPYLVLLDEEIEQYKKEEATEVNLSNRVLFKFPMKLLEIKSLKKLDLSGTHIKIIPKEIIELTGLKELLLSNCRIANLPKLPTLKVLDISNNKFSVFPQHLSKMSTLEILSLQSNFTKKEFDNFSKLTNLKSLNLHVYGNSIFPMELTSAKALETLTLSGENSLFESLPNLSVFPHLKVLKFESMEKIPYKHIEKLFNMDLSTLEELELKQNLFEMHKYEDREAFYKGSSVTDISTPRTLPKQIGELLALKKLNVSYSKLETLPNSFFKLKNLKSLECSGNNFNRETTIKINKHFKVETVNKYTNISRFGNVAWNKYQCSKGNETKLKQALFYAHKALEMAKTLNYRHMCTSPILDTVVRINLELKEFDKAYNATQEALDFDSYDENLEDVYESEGYQKWLLNEK